MSKIALPPLGDLVNTVAGADLWLLTWLPVQSTDLHDHGDATISSHAYSPRLTGMAFWEAVPDGLRRLSTVLTDQPEVAP
jgi:hypothetical protein